MVAQSAGIAAAIATPGGQYITSGIVEIASKGIVWNAKLTRLARPGDVAAMFFGHGVREVLLRLEDGREARARIAGTSFITGGERICQLVGLEPLD